MFEGFADDAVTSIGAFSRDIPTSVTLYDLIPLREAEQFLTPNPRYEEYYRRKLAWLEKADLVLAISEATLRESQAEPGLSGLTTVNVSTACSDVFRPLSLRESDRRSLLTRLGIFGDFILVAATIEPHKNLSRLLRAYARLPELLQAKYSIVLVGKANRNQQVILRRMAREAGLEEKQVIIAGHVSDEDLAALYNLCTVSVVASYHEGFGLPALEAMSCGAAVIGSNATSIPEVIGDPSALFDPHDDASIASRLRKALEDSNYRDQLKARGLVQAGAFSWDKTAKTALRAFAELEERQPVGVRRTPDEIVSDCVTAIAGLDWTPDDVHCLAISDALARSIASEASPRQLLVDVSEISQRDAKTGCQRVTRSILLKLIEKPPEGFAIEPVYATTDRLGYRYAREFKSKLTGKADSRPDDRIEYRQGDIFFALDYQAHVLHAQEPFLLALKRHGVMVCALVHDILSVTSPQFFRPESQWPIHRWLMTVAKLDGAICVSQSVAEDLRAWLHRHTPVAHNFWFDWNHHGADIESSAPSLGLPENAEEILSSLKARPTFLMVGTIEPRKGYAQALAAFDELWAAGTDVNLVIVGQIGWMMDEVVDRIRRHPQLDRRLFWLEGISDEFLAKIYSSSACLVAASEGEGFGLPLIEAARHNVAILARDIPVFREVAGSHAAYFSGTGVADLASAIHAWLALYQAGKHPKPDGLPWLTWAESAAGVSSILLKRDQQATQARKQGSASPAKPANGVARPGQLLVDISELSQVNAHTGCQRVTGGVLRELVEGPS